MVLLFEYRSCAPWLRALLTNRSFIAARSRRQLKTLTADRALIHETIIKKSRFIALARRCVLFEDALHFLQQVRTEHPKASHWCYAFVGRNQNEGSLIERFSDDGEPSGTAGVPILTALNNEALTDSVCVVVRYFGGVKLGKGGLIRAYGCVSRELLSGAKKKEVEYRKSITFAMGAENIGQLYNAIHKFTGACVDSTEYSDSSVIVTVSMNSIMLEEFETEIMNATSGAVSIIS